MQPSTVISAKSIAAGLGLADRHDLCAALAVLEATRSAALTKGALRRLFRRKDLTPYDIANAAKALDVSPVSTATLRFRLWSELTQALSLPDEYALSERSLRRDAAAMGVRAVEILAPRYQAVKSKGWLCRLFRRRPKTSFTFADLLAAEAQAMIESAEQDGTTDPQIAESLSKAKTSVAVAAVAGGGWVVGATAIGSAGFAPYMVAASASAFIPLVSGPVLVSLLAVLVNPVTVLAGATALGFWTVRGSTAKARQTAAARLAVLMALRGSVEEEQGLTAMLDALRGGHLNAASDLPNMTKQSHAAMVSRICKVEAEMGARLPAAAGAPPSDWGKPLENRQDVALAGALTAADMLYHAAAIDPAVLQAADFSRALEISTPLDLAAHLASFDSFGARVALCGYAAEQLVLTELTEHGHSVELAVTSTTPGFDLIVDGLPVQVKCGKDLSLLAEHFNRYPDIPVIADSALADMARGTPFEDLVSTIDGFDREVVQDIVDRSLSAAQSLGENALPVYALIVGAARGVGRAWRGEIPVEDLPAWMVVDLSLRGVLAGAGHAGGAAVGLVVIGPAGALILGPVLGVAALLGTDRLHDAVDRNLRSDWHLDVVSAAEALRAEVGRASQRRIARLKARQDTVRSVASGLPEGIGRWLLARMMDDIVHAIEVDEALTPVTTLRQAMQLLVATAGLGLADPKVSRSRKRLGDVLARKPSKTAAIRAMIRERRAG